MKKLPAILGPVLAVLVCLPLCAQERRVIPVTVTDKEGRFVEGLEAGIFRATYRGREVEILGLRSVPHPTKVLLLMDLSMGISADETEREEMWTAGRSVLENLSLQQESAVVFVPSAASDRKIFFTPGHDASLRAYEQAVTKAEEALERSRTDPDKKEAKTMVIRGPVQTGMWEFLQRIAEAETVSWRPGDSLVVVGLAMGPGRNEAYDPLLESLARKGLRVFVIWSGPRSNMMGWRVFAEASRRLTERTGGLWTALPESSRAKMRFQTDLDRQATALESFYNIEIALSDDMDEPREWKLEVVDERGKRRKNLVIIYPKLLVPLEEPKGN